MTTGVRQEQFMGQKVIYVLLKDGKLYVIENVPARVNQETGEQFFSPQTATGSCLAAYYWGAAKSNSFYSNPNLRIWVGK